LQNPVFGDPFARTRPDPLHSVFYDSHPSATIRIARLKSAIP